MFDISAHDEALVRNLAGAALHLQQVFVEAGLDAPRAVYVSPATGMFLKSLRQQATFLSPKSNPDPDYCATIGGLDFHMGRK